MVYFETVYNQDERNNGISTFVAALLVSIQMNWGVLRLMPSTTEIGFDKHIHYAVLYKSGYLFVHLVSVSMS